MSRAENRGTEPPCTPTFTGRRAVFPFRSWGGYDEYVAETLGTLLLVVEKFGITTPEEVGVDTLSERLHEESVTSGGVVKFRELVSAWVRKPRRRLYHPSA